MKKLYRKIICILAIALSLGSMAGCSPKDLQKYLPEERYLPQAQEPEQVAEEPNQKKAKTPRAERKDVKPIRKISVGKYAYEQLNEEGKAVYDEMLSTILDQEEKISLSTIDTEVMRHAYTSLCSDYGGLFWVNGYVFTRYTKGGELVSLEFSPKYTMAKKERQQIQKQIDAVVEQWFACISNNDTYYQKANKY